MKIVTIVGARPQFIKAAAVSRAIAKYNQSKHSGAKPITEIIVHTGQHYDRNMSEVFFDELEIPKPDINLGVGSGSHGLQTGEMLIHIEKVLLTKKPDWLMVYGDTNSTLAGALAAVKLHIPVAHVEAGLRSFNKTMPEEHNRVLTDHCSNYLYCPTDTSVTNLKKEGLNQGIFLVGDVMHDSVLFNQSLAQKKSNILNALKLTPNEFGIATVHRAENTDDMSKINSIFSALNKVSKDIVPVIVPMHPRTRKQMESSGLKFPAVVIIDPVSYLDMLSLEKDAKFILTDSGGVQKEAYWLKTPCITLRNETEWIETTDSGWNILSGAETDRIYQCVTSFTIPKEHPNAFGDGQAAEKIVTIMSKNAEFQK